MKTIYSQLKGGLVINFFNSGLSHYSKKISAIIGVLSVFFYSASIQAQCTATCTYTVTGISNASINLNSATEVLCIKAGAVFTGNINANNGGTVCIEKGASATPGSLNGRPNFENAGTLVFNSINTGTGQVINNNKDGKLTINSINFNGAATINNFDGSRGMTITAASFTLGSSSKIYNEDTLNITQGISTNTGTEILNKGWIYIGGNHFNPNGMVNNYGIISTSEFLNINGQADVKNYCWFIGDAFNYNSSKPFLNYGGIWVNDATQGWRVNSGSVELGKESIIYSLGEFLNNGLIKMITVDSLSVGAQFYVEGFSKNQGTFGRIGNRINFNDLGATTFDANTGTIISTTTYNVIPKPDTSVFASTCEARVAGKKPPVIDLDDNNSTTTGVDYLGVFTENAGAVKINDLDIKITDESGKLDSVIILLTNPLDGTTIEKLFAGTMPAGITAVVSPNGSSIKLSGNATVADYQTAISAITYNNTSENPNTTSRIILVTGYNPTQKFASAQATLTIARANDSPVALDDNNSTTEGTVSVSNTNLTTGTGSLVANDTDIDLNTLTVQSIKGETDFSTLGFYGTLVWAANGTYTYTLNTIVTEPLKQGQIVKDTFAYVAFDGNGGTATAKLIITITGLNDAPVAVDDINSITEGTTSVSNSANLADGTGNILANDSDIDKDALTVSTVQTLATAVVGTYGTLNWNTDGTYTYVLNQTAANPLKGGQTVTDVFNYVSRDAFNATATAKLTITITGLNDLPTAKDDSVSIAEGTTSVNQTNGSGNILSNDTDPDNDPLSVASIKTETDLSTIGTYGTLTWTTAGTYVYTLDQAKANLLKQGEVIRDMFPYVAFD